MTTFAERFWARVQKHDGCWIWSGFTRDSGSGYGSIRYNGRTSYPHRVAWMLSGDSLPDGMFVLHTCDNRACVRNDDEGFYFANGAWHPRRGHLWLGTHKDNMADMAAKGRQASGFTHGRYTRPESNLSGEEHGMARLTWTEIREIRARYAAGKVSWRDLAGIFGVSKSTIGFVVNGGTWKESAHSPLVRQECVTAEDAADDLIDRMWPVQPPADEWPRLPSSILSNGGNL